MKSNIINGLTLVLNNHEYNDKNTYVTLAIKCGFLVNKVTIFPSGDMIDLNPASSNVFLNYVKKEMRERYNTFIQTKVSRNLMYISFKVNEENIDSGIVYFNTNIKEYKSNIIDILTNENIIKAKENIINRYLYYLDKNADLFNKKYIELYCNGVDLMAM